MALLAVGEAVKAKDTAAVLFIDELQYAKEAELGALITALHRCAQRQLPVTLVGAGLPQLTAQLALAELDAGFFRVRLDRLSPAEKLYLRAMAHLGPGPHRSSEVAAVLEKAPRGAWS